MTEKERISQLELIAAQTLKRLDRIQDAQAKHLELSAQTSDNVTYLLEKFIKDDEWKQSVDTKIELILKAIENLKK